MTDALPPSGALPGTDIAVGLPQPRSDTRIAPLAGRMLLQVNPRKVGAVREQLDEGRSGLVLCGKDAVKTAAVLRRARSFTGVLMVDPAVYQNLVATEEDPFPRLDDGKLPMGDPLALSVSEQLEAGTTAAVTPTGYIRAEDSGALKAAVKRVAALEDPNLVFAAPIDVMWLADESLDQLIAWLSKVPGPKAVMLGGQKDPLARGRGTVANLCRLLSEVPGTALLRTDLAALGALAHGAAFTAFGHSSAARHLVPPGEIAQSSPGFAKSPHVLHPQLMDFFLGSTLADRYAAGGAPACGCNSCNGRPLDAYATNKNPRIGWAAAHNVAILMEWLRTLTAVQPGKQRQDWWRERCRTAVAQYPLVNATLNQRKGFEVPAQLKRWAADPQ
ncbi:hypothetical protein [Streptacidiphilus carbonis]|uniref:hypothetical protein n=1 Tax=Streptacidiphilus carbonis TaxID=105422 RepID=UPI00069390DD|nr:hypothetical protein [Streptacidiphilus carbonis]